MGVWQGVETKEPSYFITKENQERLARAQEMNLVQVIFLPHLEVEQEASRVALCRGIFVVAAPRFPGPSRKHLLGIIFTRYPGCLFGATC